MRNFSLILMFTLVVGCDPYGFGFKMNPAYVLMEAFEAIARLDEERFLEISGKEALCLYGNFQGLTYLKEQLQFRPKDIELKPKFLSSQPYKIPKFVGFWSYYHERYLVDIRDKSNADTPLTAVIDCDYGSEGQRDNKDLVGLNPKKYERKECKLIKIIFKSIIPLPLPKKCELLQVSL
jgi:hypothetical protein